MKQTTQRLLLSLYPLTSGVVQFPYQLVAVLLPGLTPGGQRSLLHLLQNQGFIHKDTIVDQLFLTLGDAGRKALEEEFPALKRPSESWQGQWQVVLFQSPPATDKNFRYLRKLLLNHHAMPISRGVYGFPEVVPTAVQRELESLYQGHVLVVPIGDTPNFGSLRPTVMEHFQLSDLISAYSGISSEIDQLLKPNRTLERLTNTQKKQLSTVLVRIVETGLQDPGIIRFYFPNTPNLKTVLAAYQDLLSQLIIHN